MLTPVPSPSQYNLARILDPCFSLQLIVEVLQVIKCLSNSSTPDFFGISNKLLRTVSSYVCEPIVHIANLSMTNGVFPEVFKSPIVIPIPIHGGLSLTF